MAARSYLLQPEIFAKALQARRDSVGHLIDRKDADRAARRIEMANAFLVGFIEHERRQISTEKLRRILNAAQDGTIDSCIQEMVKSGDIDDNLISYLNSLIEAECLKLGIETPELFPAPNLPLLKGSNTTQPMPKGRAILSPKASPLLRVLDTLNRRIFLEKQSFEKSSPIDNSVNLTPELGSVKILARATSISSDTDRVQYLRSVMTDRQFARKFVQFAEEGARYLTDQVEKLSVLRFFDPESSSDSKERLGETDGAVLDAVRAAKVLQAGRARAAAQQSRKIYSELFGGASN